MKDISEKKTELLAPAGDYECFLAAINAGADAVYAGGERFSARAYASNFSNKELITAIDHAHIFDRRFYLTLNTVLKNNEITELYDYISPLYEAGLDGVIVQDIGVVDIIKAQFPGLPIHASTQMAITDVQGVMLLKELGISRVVPARELNLDELKHIYVSTGVELECFIHGSMCYSYSGKCLFSSLLGGRSGNRGRCAGPCRLPYNDRYLLSLRDICTLDMIPELIEAGIVSFKIEGRMKSKEYVAGVTGIYRKYIDRYLSDPEKKYRINDDDQENLEQIYTRSGHCSGYYHQYNGRSMITIDKPSYNTAEDSRMEGLFRLYTSYTGKLRINGKAIVRSGEPFELSLNCKDHTVSCKGDIVTIAKTRPMSEADIRKQIDKLGDTCFVFDKLDIFCDDNIFIPVSMINAARREAISLLFKSMVSAHKRVKTDKKNITADINDNCFKRSAPLVNCRIDTLKLLDTVLSYDYPDIITLDINVLNNKSIDEIKRLISKIHDADKQVFISLPPVIRRGYLERSRILKSLSELNTDGFITDNYEGLYHLTSRKYCKKIISDLHMYAANDAAVTALRKLGVDVITYPVELNAGELKQLKLEGGEFMIYGRYPMMVSSQCTLKTIDRCLHDNGVSYIKDRYGNDLPCVRRCDECYNTILNCVPTMITSLDEIKNKLKPYSYMIHFTIEDCNEADTILNMYKDLLSGKKVNPVNIDHTLGHLKRGVE